MPKVQKSGWRRFLRVLVYLSLILLILIGGGLGIGWYEKKERKERQDAVRVEVEYAPEQCRDTHPLEVRILNSGEYTISRTKFSIIIRRKDHSSNLAAPWMFDLESDRIIQPRKGYGMCFRYELQEKYERFNKLEDLVFEVRNKQVYFQFN